MLVFVLALVLVRLLVFMFRLVLDQVFVFVLTQQGADPQSKFQSTKTFSPTVQNFPKKRANVNFGLPLVP